MLQGLHKLPQALQKHLCPDRQEECLSLYYMEDSLRAVLYSPEEGVGFSWEKAFEPGLDMEKDRALGQLEAAWRELKEKLQEEDCDCSKCRTLLTVAGICYREELELPDLEEGELQATLAWEVAQHVPWPEESYVWRARKLLGKQGELEEPGEEQVRMEIFALPAELVQALLKLSDELQQPLCSLGVAEAVDSLTSEQLGNIDFYERFYSQEEIRSLQNQYAAALAPVLQYCAGERCVNFLPEEQQKSILLECYRPLLQRASIAFGVLSLLIGVSGWCWELYGARELRLIQTRQTAMSVWERRLQHTQHLQKEIDLLSRERARLEEKKLFWSRQLRLLAGHIPAGCWLTRVREQNRQEFILQGEAEYSQLLDQFVESLSKGRFFQSVELLHTEQRKEKGRQVFAFSLRLCLANKVKEKNNGAAK